MTAILMPLVGLSALMTRAVLSNDNFGNRFVSDRNTYIAAINPGTGALRIAASGTNARKVSSVNSCWYIRYGGQPNWTLDLGQQRLVGAGRERQCLVCG